jgi:hypothetical protein
LAVEISEQFEHLKEADAAEPDQPNHPFPQDRFEIVKWFVV